MFFGNGISLHARLTLRYTVALGFVAVLTLASYALMENAVSTELLGAKLLNVAGRQRMLCQRVDMLAMRALRQEKEMRLARLDELEQALEELKAGHELLAHGPAEGLGLSEGHPALMVLRTDVDDRENLVHGFIDEAESVREALARGDEGAGMQSILRLNKMGDMLLQRLDEHMGALQRLGEDTLSRLRTLIKLLSGAALLGLMLTGLMLFKPMVGSVVRDREQLESLNRNLHTQAGTDVLTGLYNRRTWDAELGRELAKARRQGDRLCMIMADLDHFKRVNDAYGHQRGDRVLQEFAQRLRQTVRVSDSVFRLGGEEFALLLPGTDIEDGRVTAEKLRERVALMPLDLDLTITASFGVSDTDGHESPDEFFRRADQALYAAKAGGRNRVETRLKSA